MQFTTLGITKSIGPKEWATYMHHLVGEPTVGDAASFAATAASGTRTVSVAPGSAAAYGHDVIGVGTETLTWPRPASGGQWSMLAIERLFSTSLPGNPATVRLVILPASATDSNDSNPEGLPDSLPPAFTVQPGVKTHQQLYWGWTNSETAGVFLRDMRRLHPTTIPVGNDQQDYRSGFLNGTGIIATATTATIHDFVFTTKGSERVAATAYGNWAAHAAGPFSGGPAAGRLWLELNGDPISYNPEDYAAAKDTARPFTIVGRGTTKPGENRLELRGSVNIDSAYRKFERVYLEAMRA